jgi:hypothetical protein
LPLIAGAIDKAEHEISIFCDFPAYGCFSDPEKWLDYRHAIAKKIRQKNMHVEVTFLDQEGRRKFSPEQFGNPDAGNPWTKWKEERREQLINFLGALDSEVRLEKLSKEEFLDILESMNKAMLEDTFRAAKKYEVQIDMPVYFWLIDGRVAFFAFRYSNKRMECGFSTVDKRLIDSFQQMQYYFQKALSSEELSSFNGSRDSSPSVSHNPL